MDSNFSPDIELMKKLADYLYDEGLGNPEEVLTLFKSLRPDVAFMTSSSFLRTISLLGNRKAVHEFYRYCFFLPIFKNFERDSVMLKNMRSAGFDIKYHNYEPIDIIDKREQQPKIIPI